ncbi:hypothetical protein B0H19DRAFT_1273636 [Mycena capillaripes]|nr:hypothetical protein B0H19DRAFT_1273636 [Mycena capillaripes]
MNNELQMMKLLLVHGARVDDQFSRDGNTCSALHYACAEGKLEMIENLLGCGANLECRGYYGSALGFAVHSRKLDVIKLLATGAAMAPLIYDYGVHPFNQVPQLYLTFPASANSAPKNLKGFNSVFVGADRRVAVSMTLSAFEFSTCNLATQQREVVTGTTTISIGASSRGIRLKGTTVN